MKTTAFFTTFLLLTGSAWAQQTREVSTKSEWTRVKVPVENPESRVRSTGGGFPEEPLFERKEWPVGQGKEGIFRKTATGYEFQPGRPNAWCLIPVQYDLNGADFDLSLTVRAVGGRVPSAGLLVSGDSTHVAQNNRYIVFSINDLGQFLLQHYDQDQEEFKHRGREGSPFIRKDGDNTLRLVRQDFALRAYINGQLVANETFRRLGSKQVFVGLTTEEKARFSEFTIRAKAKN